MGFHKRQLLCFCEKNKMKNKLNQSLTGTLWVQCTFSKAMGFYFLLGKVHCYGWVKKQLESTLTNVQSKINEET